MAGSVHVIVAALKGSMDEAIKASAVPPQITDEMLTDIATRVAGHIQGSFSMESLKDPITEAIRETVRAIVTDTSERLVREEIERIKAKGE